MFTYSTCYSPKARFRMPSESSSRAPKEAFLPSTRAGRKFTARPGHLQGRHASAVLKPCGVTQALLHLNLCFQVWFFSSSHLQGFSPRNHQEVCASQAFSRVLTSSGRKMSRGMNEKYKVYVCWGGSEGGFQQASHNISTLQIYRDLLDMEVH